MSDLTAVDSVVACKALDLIVGENQVLRGIDWHVRPGERWVVLGPNGAGKSSLLRVMAGLTRPTAGALALALVLPATVGYGETVTSIGPGGSSTTHEIWWGHIIGWDSYRDQWMSEGFAEFSASLYVQLTRGNDKFVDFWEDLRQQIVQASPATRDRKPYTIGPVTQGYRLNNAKTGGAAGPLYGTGFRRAGKALTDTEAASAAEVGAALVAMLAGIQELGQAVEGDKTMVDALAPAVSAFEASAGDGLSAAAQAAAKAAADGAVATVPLQARKGRASYLGERSIGHEDPGAASTALLLRALAEVTAES